MSRIGKDEQSIIVANNLVAVDLFSQLAKVDQNLFLSPFSILTALYMAYAGARQNTAAQMERALHIKVQQDKFHQVFNRFSMFLDMTEGYELTIANALSIRSEKQILDSYKGLIKNVYGGEVLKFSADVINAWVSKRTRSHITKILEPNSLETAVMVLANAIYFKGIWHSQFKINETRDSDFYSQSGEILQVPMMHQTAKFRYNENPSIQILEMAYKGYERSDRSEKVSMIVFLPKKRDGLPKLENEITAEFLHKSISSLQRREVQVFFPRLSLETEYKLSKNIKEMGMSQVFLPGADFSGMSADPEGLMIEEVIHKATMDVDEEGTVATAATALTMTLGGPMQESEPPPVFRADHPFLFLLQDVNTGIILFIGKVVAVRSAPKGNSSVPLIKKIIGQLWRS